MASRNFSRTALVYTNPLSRIPPGTIITVSPAGKISGVEYDPVQDANPEEKKE
jgi:hypothetical protein